MNIKERYENVILDELPPILASEFETIKEETADFEDAELVVVWEKQFNFLYKSTKSKHPTAFKDYVKPEPTPEEIEAERLRIEEEKRIEDERIEQERIKAEKAQKARELIAKHKQE
jgi:hypothetical protein